MEVIMVTVVIVLILSFALFFYFKFYKERIERLGLEISEEEMDVLLANFLSMPEFQCTQRGVYRNCVDISKLYAFKKLMLDDAYHDFYINYFGWRTVTVEQIYPAATGDCTDYNYINDVPCKTLLLYENKKKSESKMIISSPISIYYPTPNKYALGRLMIET